MVPVILLLLQLYCFKGMPLAENNRAEKYIISGTTQKKTADAPARGGGGDNSLLPSVFHHVQDGTCSVFSAASNGLDFSLLSFHIAFVSSLGHRRVDT